MGKSKKRSRSRSRSRDRENENFNKRLKRLEKIILERLPPPQPLSPTKTNINNDQMPPKQSDDGKFGGSITEQR